MNVNESKEEIKAKILGETAKIPWKELQRFFAAGYTLEVQAPTDLIRTAEEIVDDNAESIKNLMDSEIIRAVPDEKAMQWFNDDVEVWAVVLAPWVLVQEFVPKQP